MTTETFDRPPDGEADARASDGATPGWLHRGLRAVLAALVLANGAIHGYQWAFEGFDQIPEIGPSFLLNTVIGAVLAVYLLLRRDLLGPALALVFSAGTAGAYVLARTVGLLGFNPQTTTMMATRALIVEVAAVIVAAALLIWELISDADEPMVDTELHR